MAAFESVDITSHAFALRLANLLVATRATSGLTIGALSKGSSGRFSRHDLKEYERASRPLDESTIDELAQLYRCDLGVILPLRLPVTVSPNRVSAGGVDHPYQGTGPDAVLAAYLTLVRTLRRQKKAPVVDLRRDDVQVLAGFLHESQETVVQRLATLMNATQTKRTAMLGVLATGAVVIGLVGTAVAVGGSETSPPESPLPESTVVVDTTVVPDTVVDTSVPPTEVPTTPPAATVPPTAKPTTPPPTTAPVATTPAATAPAATTPAATAPAATAPAATAPAATTTVPLVDTDLTTTTTIVATDGPPIPGG
jgi:hypothetical protein